MTQFNLDELFSDKKLEEEGIWIEFYEGSRLKIASMDSKAYKAELANLARKNKLRMDDDNPDYYDLIQELTCEALAKHVLKDWEGIQLNGEKNAKYKPSVGKQVLLQASKLRAFVEEAASDYKNFKKKLEEEVKNS